MKQKYIKDKKINKEINKYINNAEKYADDLHATADYIANDLNINEDKWSDLVEICENFLEQLSNWKNNFIKK